MRRSKPRAFREKIQEGEALAILPQGLSASFTLDSDKSASHDLTEDGIAIVHICGPLDHHAGGWFDNYEDILCRVEEAFQCDDARAVVLCIDSPGGEAAGSTYCHEKIRSLRKQYGKRLCAYANEMAASAAYAIACACDEIWLPKTGTVGSIGVIATMFDRTKQNEKEGVLIKLITSGEYKADNHADRPLTDDIEKRMKARVDALAEVFFNLVAKARSASPQGVAGLEAGVFIGEDAVKVGLADGVSRFDKFLRLVARSLDESELITPDLNI